MALVPDRAVLQHTLDFLALLLPAEQHDSILRGPWGRGTKCPAKD